MIHHSSQWLMQFIRCIVTAGTAKFEPGEAWSAEFLSVDIRNQQVPLFL